MVKEINQIDFKEEIKEGLVLVDFYAVWCGPCRMMHPIVDQISEEIKDVKVLKVNVDENEELARQYGIMSIPTFIIFKDGNMKEKKLGFMPKTELEKWLNENREG